MMSLIKLHVNYLFSEKIFIFTMALFGLSIGFLMLSASGVEDQYVTIQDYTRIERFYLSEVLQMGKMLIVLYLFFLMMVGYIIHQYDVLLFNVTSIIKAKTTKIISVIILCILFMSGYVLLFLLIGTLFFPYFTVSIFYVQIYLDLMFFIIYYGVLMMVMYELTQHLIGLIGPFTLYVLTFIVSIDYIKKEDASITYKALSYIGLDYNYYMKEAFSFYYSKSYYITVLLSLLVITYAIRKNRDTIN